MQKKELVEILKLSLKASRGYELSCTENISTWIKEHGDDDIMVRAAKLIRSQTRETIKIIVLVLIFLENKNTNPKSKLRKHNL